MKDGTTTTTYEIGDPERTVNPTEDNDLVQIGYKPELEVSRRPPPLSATSRQLLIHVRDDSACGR
jgi:hypothetical protein